MYKTLEENAQWINDTWSKVDRKLQKTCIKNREKLPYISINSEYTDKLETNPCWWTNGFWGGTMWLMYLGTNNEEYKTTALRSEQLLDKALEHYKKLHHDVGFMWQLTSIANYRITGNESACNKALFLASALFSRFNIEGNYIQAWNCSTPDSPSKKRSIIDTLMNLPLLYWAAEELDSERFSNVAMRHADMVIRDHIRPDGSIRHIVEHDVHTGEMTGAVVGQAYSTDSSWSRGVAWAIYGMTLSYIHTKQQRYLDAALRVADHFIAECKKTGYLPRLDFGQPDEPLYYDSTAGACAACGMIEMAKCLSDERSEYYLGEALNILKAMDANFCDYSDDEEGLLRMGSVLYPHDERKMDWVHIPIIYGDFFFVEALLKLKGNDFLIW